MHIPNSNLFPALCLENLRDINTPTQNLSTKPKPISLSGLLRRDLLVLPKPLEVRIFQPGVVRQEISELGDILKAGVDEPAFT